MTDLFASVHKVAPLLEGHYNSKALNIAIQDGKEAGQSVPHVHVHILPRKPGDFRRNDDVYEALEKQNLADTESADPFTNRTPRTMDEMELEANALRLLFPLNIPVFD